MADTVEAEWRSQGEAYRTAISSGASSSAWLRDVVLKPTIVRLLGERTKDTVLDIGSGDGWLFDEVDAQERYACDVAQPNRKRDDVNFETAAVANMPYGDGMFDAVVASIVLCYCTDLSAAAREMARITVGGGRAVVALVHPFFYRTGSADNDGDFRITADLATEETFPIVIGGTIGPFTYHRHQPTAYLNAFVENGWRLERAEDGFLPKQEYNDRFGRSDTVMRSGKVPLFSFMSFRREQ